MKEEVTVQGSFHALQTGYGILGPWDYVRLPASSLPAALLGGGKPFTLFTVVCFKNVQGGAILEQQDVFRLGIMDGKLYVSRRYHNVEGMVIEQFDGSKTIRFTGCISPKPGTDGYTQLTGMVSLGTPKPLMCELEGEIVTLWESTDIPNDL